MPRNDLFMMYNMLSFSVNRPIIQAANERCEINQGSWSERTSSTGGCVNAGEFFNSWSNDAISSLVISRVVSKVTRMGIELVWPRSRRWQQHHAAQTSNLLPKHKKIAVGTAYNGRETMKGARNRLRLTGCLDEVGPYSKSSCEETGASSARILKAVKKNEKQSGLTLVLQTHRHWTQRCGLSLIVSQH